MVNLASLMQKLIETQNGSLTGGYLSINNSVNNSYLLVDGSTNKSSCNNPGDCSNTTNEFSCHNTGKCTAVVPLNNPVRCSVATSTRSSF